MRYAWTAAIVLVMAALLYGCASTPGKAGLREIESPERGKGQVAVFGRAYVVEDIEGFHPIESQEATVYIEDESDGEIFKFSTNENGEFGLYLNPGRYRFLMAQYCDYRFIPNVWINVPKDDDLLYVGAIEFDGTPSGIVRQTELSDWLINSDPRGRDNMSDRELDFQRGKVRLADTKFIYTIKDESEEFLFNVKMASPGLEDYVKIKLMVTEGAVAVGKYDEKVHRAKDVTNKLEAESRAFEEIFGGVISSIPYAANPLLLLTPPW